MRRWAALLLAVAACDSGSVVDAGVADAGIDAAIDECAGFTPPPRPDTTRCDAPSAADPERLVECARGSGHAGLWTIDADGFPAYDLAIDQRCDPAGQHWSPRPDPQRDPLHLIGNGRGLVAMAHASGGIEIYSQDRGHAWINRIDTWVDPRDRDFPPQLGGGFSYLSIGGRTLSTRFEDLPVGEALARQTRRFGVGYVETVTRFDGLVVTRRVYAPETDARALIAEVTLESTGDEALEVGLVELWDPNLHQVAVELATSDVAGEALMVSANIDRRRRGFVAAFTQTAAWDGALARVDSVAEAPPVGRLDPSEQDYFPPPIYLAALDGEVDGVWLVHEELFGEGVDRAPPATLDASAEARSVTVNGAGQPTLLALRVPIALGPGERATRRFAFGYAPGEAAIDLAPLRAATFAATREAWRARTIHGAFEGVEHAGAVQRELAWSSYMAIANATFDEYQGVRLAGQGGSYKYIHGLDGAMGDLALFADALLLVDPDLARDTLAYAMGFQAHSGHELGGGRYPYASTGVGSYSDVGIYALRTDAYWIVPASVARYVAITRDAAFLDRELPFWPRSAGERGTVREHVERGLDFAESERLGYGARGLAAMGTNDYADGILQLSPHETTPSGASSTFNALFIALGLPLAAEVFGGPLGARMQGIATSQIAALEAEAWTGDHYVRGFADDGSDLTPDYLFVEPQVLPILAGLVDGARRDQLLDLVEARFETPLGAMTTVRLGDGPSGGPDAPQIGGVWPVASAWVTDAWSRRDPARGWSSFVRNTLFNHGELYPGIWYGIWAGPDSYNGPDHPRAGEADAHIATALTDYPVFNAHVHLGPLRALQGVLGIEATATGMRIAPRVPTETWTVRFPRLWLEHRTDSFAVRVFTTVAAPIELRVRVPEALRAGAVTVEGATTFARDGDDVVLALDASPTGAGFLIRAE